LLASGKNGKTQEGKLFFAFFCFFFSFEKINLEAGDDQQFVRTIRFWEGGE